MSFDFEVDKKCFAVNEKAVVGPPFHNQILQMELISQCLARVDASAAFDFAVESVEFVN